MRTILGVVLAAVLAAQVDPAPIQRMAATERAFAAATAEIGVRDGFLTFFADDAVQIEAGATGSATKVSPARPELLSRPLAKLPVTTQLMWEPFTGQVSGDGTLGWLTGAYASLNLPTRDIVSHGAYFSVWERKDDGTWRVWLDEGVNLPSVWQDAAPFRAAPEPDAGTAGSADETLDAVEHLVASGSVPWRARLAADIRVHRDGRMPILGREAATTWAATAWTAVTSTLVTSRTAASNDLGIAVGGYDAITTSGREHGTWVRVWKRDITGRWRIVFETSKARP